MSGTLMVQKLKKEYKRVGDELYEPRCGFPLIFQFVFSHDEMWFSHEFRKVRKIYSKQILTSWADNETYSLTRKQYKSTIRAIKRWNKLQSNDESNDESCTL